MDLQEVGFGMWAGWKWLIMGTVEGRCECGNELSGSVKRGGFLEWLRTG